MFVAPMAVSLSNLRRLVVILLGISFFLNLITGILKFPELTRLTSALLLPFNYLSFIHDWSGIALAALIIIHLLLHWGRFIRMFGGSK
jgi:cytochrome b subunit of formate dehydrogenase